MRGHHLAQGINGIRIAWRSGRHAIWCYIMFGSVLWCSVTMPEIASGQEAPLPPLPDAGTNRPFETGAMMLERAMGVLTNPNDPNALARQFGFQATGRAGVDFTYTDNAFLTANDRKEDFIVTPKVDINLSDNTMRAAFVADAELDYDYYTNYHSLSGARPTALVDGLVDLFPGEFSLEARGATSLQNISPIGQTPATDRLFGDNEVEVLNFGGRPTWREHIGDEVQTEVFYDVGAVRFLSAPNGPEFNQASDTVQQLVQATISSGPHFSRFSWSVIGSYQELDPSDATSLSNPRTSAGHAELSTQYRVNNALGLTVRGGYEWFDEPTIGYNLDGPFGLVGFVWHPDRRTNVRIEAGYRYKGFDADATIGYSLARSLNLSAIYSRSIQNTQQGLIAGLTNLTNPNGSVVIDPATGLPENLTGLSGTATPPNGINPLNPNLSAIGYTNVSFKHDLYQVGVAGQMGRNSYSISGDYQKYMSILGNSYSWDANVTLSRDLTRRLKVSAEGAYDKVSGAPQGFGLENIAGDTKSAGARADYRLGPTVTLSLRYAYLWRSTTLLSYRENAVVLGAIKRF